MGRKSEKVDVISAQPLLKDVVYRYLDKLRMTHRRATVAKYEGQFRNYIIPEFGDKQGFLEKIFGIGFGTYDSYYALGRINVYNGEVEYMSSISYILVCGGIIGLILFSLAIVKYTRPRNYLNYALILFLFVIFFSSSILNSPIYAVVILVISHNCIKAKNERGEHD